MAEQGASERTEQATPERLRKAREEGNVPSSDEVPSALILVMLLVVLALGAEGLLRYFATECYQGLTLGYKGSMDIESFGSLLKQKTISSMLTIAPYFIAIVTASLLGSFLAGGGINYSTKVLAIDWSRLSPIKGFQNLISLKSLVHMLISVCKFAVIGAIVWNYLQDKLTGLMTLNYTSAENLLLTIGQLTLGAAGRIAVAMMVIAGADLLYQRWNYRKQLMMSKQEIKEENKNYQLPMEVRSRQRGLQMSMARKRAAKAVPSADVVVTNPTHYAVALKYEPGKMAAPVVVAKGADLMAKTIRQIAQKHDVPIVEKPELARALFAAVDEGQAVPETLFFAVAEVLAMIFKLRKKKRVR
jgi:flagellar biosynthesis protein FlhB